MVFVRTLVCVLLTVIAAGTALAEPTPLGKAEALLAKVPWERDLAARFKLADEAQALCEKLLAENPANAPARLTLARALTTADPAHPESCRPGHCERAVEELRRARAQDPRGIDAERIASELGIVLSRLQRFPEALIEYDRALGLVEGERRPGAWDEGFGRGVLWSNSAETLMALGRLDEAVDRYRQAEAHATLGDLEWQLAQWGLGVAFDRDQQLEKSRSTIARVLDHDPTMARLSEEGVFFEPPGDKHYYLALGHEVAGDREQAIASWRAYLAEAPKSRWVPRARAHLRELLEGGRQAAADDRRVEVGFGDVLSLRPLRTPWQVDQGLKLHEGDVRLCYARALREKPRLRGEVRLALQLNPSGFVAGRPQVLAATVDAPQLVRCLEMSAAGWRFPTVAERDLETLVVPIRLGPKP
jgi:tetratricopeptide (TPR) repeat protein